MLFSRIWPDSGTVYDRVCARSDEHRLSKILWATEEGDGRKNQKLIEDSKEDDVTLVGSDSDDQTLVDSDGDSFL